MRKVGKNPKSKLQHENDALLQSYITKKYPKCEICGGKSTCGHHLVEKSRSNALRYEIKNIVPVCQICHARIHNMVCGRLGNNSIRSYNILEQIFIRRGGDQWKDDLEKEGRQIIKTNMDWYRFHNEKLKKLIAEI